MATVVWRNIGLVPKEEPSEALREPSNDGTVLVATAQNAGAIFVYLRRGAVIEVRPANSVHLTSDCLEILDEQQVVATYPRERVVFASHHLVSPLPYC